MTITDIYEAMNGKAESFFEWVQAHPKYGLLLAAGLLVLWLVGILFRWKWACHWQFGGKLWMFDNCKPETRHRIQMALIGLALAGCLTMFFAWR
ncbi:Imm17 family immunity protein [Bacteroides rodentium]|uniref:Imm17 family immunity protein n=1 Tax=Bacteroides rodentium TaxID=691816 RepID=UPI0004729044|nr:Imm17 family immunity protein [Bacteroides rodentium]